MKIAVVGANTELGGKLVLKAEKEGINVVNLVSSFDNVKGNGQIVIKDYEDITRDDIADCHYVVDVLSFFNISKFSSELLPLWHLLEILKDSDIRLLELGSSAFLYTDSTRSKLVVDTDSYILDETQNKIDRLCVNAYKRLSLCRNVSWSVLCPPLMLDEFAFGSGEYEFSNDVLPVGLNGDSYISENDFLSACVELLKRIPEKHRCISVKALKK